MRIAGFVLPHLRYLSDEEALQAAGPRGWLEQQGFYVYRRDRLILAGDWLGIRGFRKEDKYILARLAVDIPAELDSEWSIDVRKSAAIPPLAARPHLRRIGARARRVRRRRPDPPRPGHRPRAWRRLRLRLDRPPQQRPGHLPREPQASAGPARCCAAEPKSRADAAALIRLLEETVPVAALRVMHQAETIDDPEPFAGAADEEAVASRRTYPGRAHRPGLHPA